MRAKIIDYFKLQLLIATGNQALAVKRGADVAALGFAREVTEYTAFLEYMENTLQRESNESI